MTKKIDLTGKVFGQLTVISPSPSRTTPKGQKRTFWHCRCSCGKRVSVWAGSLSSGDTTSCGCYHNKRRREKRIDITGRIFGRLTVIGHAFSHKTPSGQSRNYVCCQCTCGKSINVVTGALTSGNTTSCGCYRAEQAPKGDKHPFWNPNLTDEYRTLRRRRLSLNQTSKLPNCVFARDNYTCQHCGDRRNKLRAHHIMPWAEYPTLRYAVENCITLCKVCHDDFHALYGMRDFDDQDLTEYLKTGD